MTLWPSTNDVTVGGHICTVYLTVPSFKVERSLLAGEWSAEEGRLRKMSYRLALLKSGENRLAQELERWRAAMAERADDARRAVADAEADIER